MPPREPKYQIPPGVAVVLITLSLGWGAGWVSNVGGEQRLTGQRLAEIGTRIETGFSDIGGKLESYRQLTEHQLAGHEKRIGKLEDKLYGWSPAIRDMIDVGNLSEEQLRLMQRPTWTVDEAAQALGVTPSKVREMCDSGDLQWSKCEKSGEWLIMNPMANS